jgi:hypothetical protein
MMDSTTKPCAGAFRTMDTMRAQDGTMYGINAEIALRLKAVQAEFGLANPAAIAGQALGP